jgi:acetoin utilization protein AcuB
MLIGERMAHPVITVNPEVPVTDALKLIKSEHIRHLPVVHNGKLVGIVTEKDLLYASPSPATSLNIWEMYDLLSKVHVENVMSKEVITVTEDTPVEEAAALMAEKKIGALPVMRDDKLVGIVTETTLLKMFAEMMGKRQKGVRATVLMAEKPGEYSKVTQAIFTEGGNILTMANFAGEDPTSSVVTFKLVGIDPERLREVLTPLVLKVKDIRIC